MEAVPPMTRAQVRRVDRLAIEKYGLPGVVLMENAGRAVAELLRTEGIAGTVEVVCGKGNNGGDGFVIARHLSNWGFDVRVKRIGDAMEMRGDAAINYRVLEACGWLGELFQGEASREQWHADFNNAAWIVDALLGTGAIGAPRADYATVIELMNHSGRPILAVDLPSGLNADTGEVASVAIHATITATFVAPKIGFARETAKVYLGQVTVIDIGVPRMVIDEARVSA